LALLFFPDNIWYKYCIKVKRRKEIFFRGSILNIRHYLIFILVLCLFPVNILALNLNSPEWELKVLVEKANIRTEPDEKSPVVTYIARGAMLKSYERTGAWFRVIIGSDKVGFVSLGYIHVSDVEIVKEKLGQETDFWKYEEQD